MDSQLLITGGDDQEIAAQVLQAAESAYRYCWDTGTWVWAGADRWEAFPGDPCGAMIATQADKIPRGTKPAKGTEPGDMTAAELDYLMHARLANTRTASGIAKKMAALAPASAAAVAMRDLDADGTVMWAGGRPWHLPASYAGLVPAVNAGAVHLKSAGYAPALGPVPLWDALTKAAFPFEDVRDWWLWETCSACTTSNGKGLVHLAGPRDTAKTTVIRCLADLLGSYAVQIPRPLLSGQQAHEGTVLRLAGARLAWFDEKPRRGIVAQEFLKELTGGGAFEARPPHGRGAVSGHYSATVLLASNDELPLTDPALLSRVRRVPMLGDPDETRAARNAIVGPDGSFTPAWRREAPAVLGRLMVMCAQRMNGHTVEMPHAAAVGLAEAAAEQDSAGAYIAAELARAEAGAGMTTAEVHGGYVAWCRAHNVGPADTVHVVPFGKRLAAEFGEAARTRRGSVYPVRMRQPGAL